MNLGYFDYPLPANEPILAYGPGSAEKHALKQEIRRLKGQQVDIPMFIGSDEVRSGKRTPIFAPHDHSLQLGHFHKGDRTHVEAAIESALQTKARWNALSWEQRAGIFLKAADLLAGPYRAEMNAATMLGQSKNVFQAEIDGVCELVDFLRFNVHFLSAIYKQQPLSPKGSYNRVEYRPLEGFVLAITPFNFTSIGGNLPTAPALCGNTVVWKPADTQIYSAQVFMRILKEAGLPDGVINLIYVEGEDLGAVCFQHPDLAGLHFTGSTQVFQHLWKSIGENISRYRSYPRIVGETGGKDFVLVHPSADVPSVVANLLRGAYEFQGQKCSAASRAYLPKSLADLIIDGMVREMATFKMGSPEDFTHFINAVIDERAFDKISAYIDKARHTGEARIVAGGGCEKAVGYFIEPTLIEALDPTFVTMREEIFGPVLTYYVYDDENFEQVVDLVDQTSSYALTGALFARDRHIIEKVTRELEHNAGNFYVNDKPTGAVVGQQPFGGARGSGTNDKAGSMVNLYRWLSMRTIKETYVPVSDYRYPFLGES